MKKTNSRNIAVSSVVGNILLVAIVFMMGSMFAGLVLTNDYDPNPSATVEFEQVSPCERGADELCETVLTVKQMGNADYIVVAYRAPAGATVPQTTVTYEGENPAERENVPNIPEDTATLDSGNADRGAILIGPGDKYNIKSDVGTEIFVYGGLDGYEDLIYQYEVQENENSFL